MAYFIEITSKHHGGGPVDVWGLGKALWSPSRNKTGGDTYKLMREVKPGDKIIHSVAEPNRRHVLTGTSECAQSVITTGESPNEPGKWVSSEYYRVPLKNFVEFENKLETRSFLQQNKSNLIQYKGSFYDVNYEVNQIYLARLTDQEAKMILDFVNGGKQTVDILTEKEINNSLTERISSQLLISKNIILHGAPGTGKTYLAKQVAERITGFEMNSEEFKKYVGFVQFHPSYDYTDFVEGLRPVNNNGNIGFELVNGSFKSFCLKARKKIKPVFDFVYEKLLNEIQDNSGKLTIYTSRGTTFDIEINSKTNLNIIGNNIGVLSKSELQNYYQNGQLDVVGRKNYYTAILRKLMNYIPDNEQNNNKYVFIIDEINRGEISKIFGELFYSLDPGYRGIKGAVSTQYNNLHPKDELFYVPENVYIIGTMNDIDRSVDTFDFAMRRRFRFIQIKPIDTADNILNSLGNRKDEALRRMNALNRAIEMIDSLDNNYHVGPAYFKHLEDRKIDFPDLYSEWIEPLLSDYVKGMDDSKQYLEDFRKAYFL